ncbi:MAG: DNA gyrase modulator [Acetobacteraceae bacterium]
MKTQEDLLSALLDAAKKAGADQADAMLVETTSLSTTIRQGRLEDTEHAQTVKLGLRVFSGRRVANVFSTVIKKESFARLASQAVTMARALPKNPHAGLASSAIKGQLSAREMRLTGPTSNVTIAQLQEASRIAEESALAGDGITKSNGASASSWRAHVFSG